MSDPINLADFEGSDGASHSLPREMLELFLEQQEQRELESVRQIANQTRIEANAMIAEVARLREENAVLKSQVENADVNLEQVRMAQKAMWRTKVESAESRIATLEAQVEEMGTALNQIATMSNTSRESDIARIAIAATAKGEQG